MTITSALKHDETWAKAGHEVAWDQLELTSWNLPAHEPLLTSETISSQEDDQQIKISGNGF